MLLTTSEVGGLLKVHPSTVKRWCNEGELSVSTTDGGHRRVKLGDALQLSSRRGIPTLLDAFAPYEAHVWTALQDMRTDEDARRAISLSMGWLTHGKAERIGSLISVLGNHPEIPLSLLLDGFLLGLMREVGERWRSGSLRVGAEHIASQIIIESLMGLRRPDEQRPPDDAAVRPTAVVGAMEGDQHHIGALCVRLILERRGWRVVYLGPDVPVEEFSGTQIDQRASLVCISFSPPRNAADIRRAIRILQEFYSDDSPYALAVGGSGVIIPSDGPIVEGPFARTGIFVSASEFMDWVSDLESPHSIASATQTVGGEDQ